MHASPLLAVISKLRRCSSLNPHVLSLCPSIINSAKTNRKVDLAPDEELRDRYDMISWTHITLEVSDFERSIRFYRQYCSLSVIRDRRLEGGDTIWLGPETDADKNPLFVLVLSQSDRPQTVDHLGFQCTTREELESIATTAKSENVCVAGPTQSEGVVGYWVTVTDPDGNIVEFTFGQPITGIPISAIC